MSKREFDPALALGDQIAAMSRQELVSFVIELCRAIRGKVGLRSYCGGIYPENISRDEEGCLAVGEGRLSDWKGQELDYVAPELYWHGKYSQATDVYALGLILCYGLSGGKLPFEGESPNAQLSRMSGRDIPAPPEATGFLRDVITRAISFEETKRYQTVAELEIHLDSCLDNKFLGGESESKAIFRKDDEELSDRERMMVDILQKENEDDVPPPAPAEEPETQEAQATRRSWPRSWATPPRSPGPRRRRTPSPWCGSIFPTKSSLSRPRRRRRAATGA